MWGCYIIKNSFRQLSITISIPTFSLLKSFLALGLNHSCKLHPYKKPHTASTNPNTAIKPNFTMDPRTNYISKLYINTAKILSGMLFFLIKIAMSRKVCSINYWECMIYLLPTDFQLTETTAWCGGLFPVSTKNLTLSQPKPLHLVTKWKALKPNLTASG